MSLDGRRVLLVVAWLVVGVLAGVGLLSLLSVGALLLGTAALLALLLTRRGVGSPAVTGLLLGLAAASGFMAWTNRWGPGEVCSGDESEQVCTSNFDPLPWLVAALALVVLATVVHLRGGRHQTEVDRPVP